MQMDPRSFISSVPYETGSLYANITLHHSAEIKFSQHLVSEK